jgi:membrane-bound inhibitor of C-type lysozyme|tara:strand:- start:1661 stop:1888 length:228 start_codon:yes stop_codon:yes gene_type:complete
MEPIIIKTMTLILYMGGDVSEHTAYEKISKCLKAKRTIERNLYKKSTSVRYSCENKTVEVSKNTDGTNYIVRIIE